MLFMGAAIAYFGINATAHGMKHVKKGNLPGAAHSDSDSISADPGFGGTPGVSKLDNINFAFMVTTTLHEVAHLEFGNTLGFGWSKSNDTALFLAHELYARDVQIRGLKALKDAGELTDEEFAILEGFVERGRKKELKKHHYSPKEIAKAKSLVVEANEKLKKEREKTAFEQKSSLFEQHGANVFQPRRDF